MLILRDHTSPYVRGAVLRFVSELYPELATKLLFESLRDQHALVRQNAIDELDDLGMIESLPSIRLLLNDSHPDVRQAAQTAVANLEARGHTETAEHL